MQIREIHYTATLDIRRRVLWPDKAKEFCIVDGDATATHYGLFLQDTLIGVASLYENSGAIRLRKFAVDTRFQGNGYGTTLLSHAIDSARARDALCFWCDARETAIQFYQQFGLQVDGNRFYKSDIPYFTMSLTF